MTRPRRSILSDVMGRSLLALSLVIVGGDVVAEEVHAEVYPLAVCAGCGAEMDASTEPVSQIYEGRDLKFCQAACVKAFEAAPEEKIAAVDKAIVDQQLPHYPLDTCIVSGQKLGSMGEAVNLVRHNRLVRFCCQGCVSTFQKDSGKYLSQLNEAVIAKQKTAYPLDTCVVSGQKLGAMGEPVDYVSGNRLVRFCCQGCVGSFEKHPSKYLKRIDEAAQSASSSKSN